jgi:hypothetical protein
MQIAFKKVYYLALQTLIREQIFLANNRMIYKSTGQFRYYLHITSGA